MLELLANFTMRAWSYGGAVLGVYGLLNYVVLGIFAGHRMAQLRDRDFDLRPTVPTHAALHNYCAILYGIVLPAFYFLTVRLRHKLALWYLGSNVNHRWTIALGVICVLWLAGHVIHSIRSGDRMRFGGRSDRIFAGLAFGLCLWFHFWTGTSVPMAMKEPQLAGANSFWLLALTLFYPQSHFLGATLVYGFAFAEACRNPAPAAMPRRRRVRTLACSACAVALIFAPWWLSLPRVTHGQAVELIRANLPSINSVAEQTRFDPRLLAGIIYVAQTRDHPRWTGDFIDEFGILLNEKNCLLSEVGDVPVFDSSIGLCQMRPTTFYCMVNGTQPQTTSSNWPLRRDTITSFQYRAVNFQPIRMSGYRGKDATREFLKPDLSLNYAVLMLHLLRDQWSRGGFPIDDRPEILATLYNIGFERSIPKSNPKPNDFGRRVKAFMDSPDCLKLFETASNHSAKAAAK